eukprot:scaffold730_cov75-Skeletonema_marinoi.AAC.2
MQTIPACLHAILHASNSFLYKSYSHLSLLKGGGGILIDHNDRNLLALTDDEEVYDDYIATTVDSGWMWANTSQVNWKRRRMLAAAAVALQRTIIT